MLSSNNLEKHGSDLRGPGANINHNEFPPSSHIPTFPPSNRYSGGATRLSLVLPREAMSYKLDRELQLK